MATDYISGAYAKMWTLLFAHVPVADAIKPGNRISLDKPKGDVIKENIGDSDTPRLTAAEDDFSDSEFTDDQFYGEDENADPSAIAWLDTIRQTFTIVVVHRNLDLTAANALKLEILTALRKGGPTWGLPYIDEWGPVTGNHAVKSRDEAGGTRRLITTFKVPVLIRFQGNQNLS